MTITLSTLGPNCHRVHVGALSIGFSYETPVMFTHPETGTVISKNVWSSATGKHLNMLTGRSMERVEFDDFEFQLQSILNRLEIRRGIFK